MRGFFRFSRSWTSLARSRAGDERGWALIDALASSLVVVLAFTGTTMAFNGSTDSVKRDAKKTAAMIVAQDEINEMRAIGTRSINDLLAKNGTTATVSFEGTDYQVAYSVYYVTGLGSDQRDACSVSYSSTGATARYIYMKVSLTYSGQTRGSSSSSSQYISNPTTLDSYFSPEGGGTQADTGTLRIYVLKPDDSVATGVSTVQLSAPGMSTRSELINPATGCVLFKGLLRNTYTVKVPVNGKQDIYLGNTSGSVSTSVVLPDRGALSREIRIAYPVKVTPTYRAYNDNGDYVVGNTSNNAFYNKWIASSDQVRLMPSTDYLAPEGLIFMPHADSTATPEWLYPADKKSPLVGGYSAYSGPCDVNNPNLVGDGINYWNAVPEPGSQTTTWKNAANSNNLTISPTFWLSRLAPSVSLGTTTSAPGSPGSSRTYYYGQTFSGGATVKVRLIGGADGTTPAEVNCKPNTALYNTWQTLPGTIDQLDTQGLPDNAEALPAGMYEVCISVPYKTVKRSSSFWGSWNSPTTVNSTAQFLSTEVLTYQSNVGHDFNMSFDSGPSQSLLSPNGSTTC